MQQQHQQHEPTATITFDAACCLCSQMSASALHHSCLTADPQAGIIGITATAGAKNISHTFSLAFTLAILTNLAQFMAHKAAAKRCVGGAVQCLGSALKCGAPQHGACSGCTATCTAPQEQQTVA